MQILFIVVMHLTIQALSLASLQPSMESIDFRYPFLSIDYA